MEHVNTVPNNTGNLKTRVVEKIPKVFTGVDATRSIIFTVAPESIMAVICMSPTL
jgi:ABC-type branched-subunit amino acid transport system ATPase component